MSSAISGSWGDQSVWVEPLHGTYGEGGEKVIFARSFLLSDKEDFDDQENVKVTYYTHLLHLNGSLSTYL